MKPKILVFDSESSNLVGDYGRILCIGYKWLGEKDVKIITIRKSPVFKQDPTNDKYVVEEFAKVFSQAHMVIGWFSRFHDVPLIDTRLMAYSLPPLPPVPHWDGWFTAKKKMKLRSNRLASVSTFMNLSEKTPLTAEAWVKAPTGHIQSLKYVEDHCIADVVVTEQAYERMKAFSYIHFDLSILEGQDKKCPVCLSVRYKVTGRWTSKVAYERLQCQQCGHGFKGGKIK
jgi:hypothetical protein